MGEIIVKKDFSAAEEKKARLDAARFRKSKYTTAVSNVMDVADLGNTVLLCADHVKKFATPAVLSKYGYRKVDDYPYVMGNCDYCGLHDKCRVFSHESVFGDVWKTKDEKRREISSSTVVR